MKQKVTKEDKREIGLPLSAALTVILFLFMLIPGIEGFAGEVSRDFCAFAKISDVAKREKCGKVEKGGFGLGTGVKAMKGVTFDFSRGAVTLKGKQCFVVTPADLVYAGEKDISTMTHRDMGPLAFYALPEVFLLHAVKGEPSDELIGKVVFEYEDGTKNEEELYLGENIGSEKVPAEWSEKVDNGFCVTSIMNPVPYEALRYQKGKGHAVKSLSIVITNPDVEYRLAAMTCRLGRQKVHH